MKTRFEMKKLMPCYAMCEHCNGCKLPQNAWPSVAYQAIGNLWALRNDVLDPARERYGKSIRVLRSFLCLKEMMKLKKEMRKLYGLYDMDWDEYYYGECADLCAVKGWAKMIHEPDFVLDGWKAVKDFPVPNKTKRENLAIARAIAEGGVWDRMILWNVGEEDWIPEFVHVSYKREGVNRCQVLLRRKESEIFEEIDSRELLY